MNKSFISLILLTNTCAFAANSFDHMHAMIENMRQMSDQINRSFEEMHQRMNESLAQISNQLQEKAHMWSVAFEETEESAILKIKGVKTDSIDATLDEEKDMMRIKTDEGIILVYSAGKAVQVTIRQEHRAEGADRSKHQVLSASQSSMTRTTGAELDLEQSSIDYHKEESELTLKLNKKKRKSKTKNLPVTIK